MGLVLLEGPHPRCDFLPGHLRSFLPQPGVSPDFESRLINLLLLFIYTYILWFNPHGCWRSGMVIPLGHLSDILPRPGVSTLKTLFFPQ